ncbi:hypothetical protein CW731_00625 [Polaribacter sp. ALD11]|uniref:hypothetical protein n=1 Tax=Polaribacter sp. ALD11 TaxID=2058137 RepID=UPI000C30CD48|nr:hypothetical protein [Polaribacter sp. ALD11]AUC83881.1 hypothetical protein CW731_00625 [Polaribacter sp. ALD11]
MKIFSVPKGDFIKIANVFLREAGVFIASVFILFFDGVYFNKAFFDVQTFLNILMISAFIIMFYRAVSRIKELMLYAVILGFIGEYLFSKGLNMYSYRLQNIPLYVPFGHAVLFARVFRFSKASVVKKYKQEIAQLFAILIAIFAVTYLVFYKDVFGFVMTIGVFLLFRKKHELQLFFYTMYILVAVLEIVGTGFGVWKWPNIAFGIFEVLPSNNPPSGISLFYFLLNITCLFIYTKRHKVA